MAGDGVQATDLKRVGKAVPKVSPKMAKQNYTSIESQRWQNNIRAMEFNRRKER